MTEMERRREARRQMILANSENRLRRILGEPQATSSPDASPAQYDSVSTEPHFHTPSHSEGLEPTAITTDTLRLYSQRQNVKKAAGTRQWEPNEKRAAVVVLLAVLTNTLVCFELASSALFSLLLVFEMFIIGLGSFTSSHSETTSSIPKFLLLLHANIHNDAVIKNIMAVSRVVFGIMQDIMVFFFVFVCCEGVKCLLVT